MMMMAELTGVVISSTRSMSSGFTGAALRTVLAELGPDEPVDVKTSRRADVIVYATGFQASRFLTPMKVVGSDGRDLHDPRARALADPVLLAQHR